MDRCDVRKQKKPGGDVWDHERLALIIVDWGM